MQHIKQHEAVSQQCWRGGPPALPKLQPWHRDMQRQNLPSRQLLPGDTVLICVLGYPRHQPAGCQCHQRFAMLLTGILAVRAIKSITKDIIVLSVRFAAIFQFMLPKEKVIYIMQNKDYVVINNFAAFIYRSLLLVN